MMNGQPVISVRGEASLEAADTGLLTPHARPDTWRFSGASAAAGRRSVKAESAQPELDLEPERQIVSAQVEARFAMTRPASGQAGA